MGKRLYLLTAGLMAVTTLALAQSRSYPPGSIPNPLDPTKTLVDDRKPNQHNLTAEELMPGAGFQSLFNGKDLAGWSGNPKLWSVKDGAITGQTTAEHAIQRNTFLIWTNGMVTNFELRCSFRLVPGDAAGFANSGIQYRSKVVDPAQWVVHGYQADMEAGPTYTGILYEEGLRGIMATRGEQVVWDKDCKKQVTGSVGDAQAVEASLTKGGWNDYVIIAYGPTLQHFVNGKKTVQVNDDCESKRALSGVLALQLHAGHPMMVQFKNLRIRSLPVR